MEEEGIKCLIKCRGCKNVIKIVDVYKNYNFLGQEKYYIITDFYENGNLYNYIKKKKKELNKGKKLDKEKNFFCISNY